MSIAEALGNLIGNLIGYGISIAIIILPFYIMLKLGKAMIKAIKRSIKKRNLKVYESPREWNTDWTWDESCQLWVHQSELERQVRLERSEPTYEEWKAAREAQTKRSSDGTYHLKNVHITAAQTTIPNNNVPKPEQRTKPTFTEPKYEPPKNNYVWESVEWTPKPKTEQKPESHKPTQVQQKPEPSKQNINNGPEPPKKHSEYENAYEATPVLTQNEMRNYRTLWEAAMRRGYSVNVKTRLADIIKPRNDSKYMSHFGKIKSKHVDFVILDRDMKIKAIVELDDNSHDRKDRKERDVFVDTILQDCGFTVIHTRHITPDILDNI